MSVLGALTMAPGAEAARSLDTCPTPSWGPGSGPRIRLRWGLETRSRWGWKWERRRGRPRRRGGLATGPHLGVRQSAEGARGVALWEGRSGRMAAGVAGPRSPANSWRCLELRAALQRCVGSGHRAEKARVGGGTDGGAVQWLGERGARAPLKTLCPYPAVGGASPLPDPAPADLASLPRDRCCGALFGGLGVTRPYRCAEVGARTCLGA